MFRKSFVYAVFLLTLFLFGQSSLAQKKKISRNKNTSVPNLNSDAGKKIPLNKTKTPAVKLTPEQKERYETFDLVWKTINENYFDKTFNNLNWKDIRAEYLPKIKYLKSNSELFTLLQEMVNRLGSSHLNVTNLFAFNYLNEKEREIRKKEIEAREKLQKEKNETKNNIEEILRKLENKPEKSIEGETENSKDDLSNYDRFGIPIGIRAINSQVLITKVEKGSNAEKAGIRPGFIIEKINGVPLGELIQWLESSNPYARVLKNGFYKWLLSVLEGEKDFEVELTYLDENNLSKNALLKREKLKLETFVDEEQLTFEFVDFEKKSINEKTGYIKFDSFVLPVIEKFCEALTEFKSKEAIIIDLRGNPGGSLEVVKGLIGLLTDKMISIGTLISRSGKEEIIIDPLPKNYKGKLFILVDGQSASSSELFSSSLQENGRATVIGEKTAGKVLVSNEFDLPIGGSFIFPVSNFKSSKGRTLEGNGVLPNYHVPIDRKSLLQNRDASLEKALEILENSKTYAADVNKNLTFKEKKPRTLKKAKTSTRIGTNLTQIVGKQQDFRALEVVKNFIKALGGEAALRKISSFSARGSLEQYQRGVLRNGNYQIYRKAPNKLSEEVGFFWGNGGFRNIFDGKNSFIQSSFTGIKEQKDFLAKREHELFAVMDEPLKFSELYQHIKYLGVSNRLGRKTHLIKATTKDGVQITFDFDINTNLLLRRAGKHLNYTFDKYQKFEGIMFPTFQTRNDGLKIKFSTVDFTTEMPESKFMKEENCLTKID